MTHIAHAFTPTPDDPTGERTAPLALFTEPRCHSEPMETLWWVNRTAVNATPEPAPEPRQEQPWWLPIVNGLWHAWRAGELCDTWTRDDLADAIADALVTEARLLTEETEELVTVPNAALAAVARVRKGE